jgi:ActR/RegA family two-component response regulator
MKNNKKKVLFIDADGDFLDRLKRDLNNKNLENYFFPFNDFWNALHFVEKQIIEKNKKLHYIILDEKIIGRQLDSSLEKISEYKNYMNNPEIIFCTSQNNSGLRNRVMQHRVITAFLVKPIPEDYVEFLITGS